MGWIPGLAQWVKDPAFHKLGIGHRCGSIFVAVAWAAAAAPIQPITQELPCATCAAQKKKKKGKKKKNSDNEVVLLNIQPVF